MRSPRRLRQRRVQWLARDFQRLHSRWIRLQPPVAIFEYRSLHKSCHWTRCRAGSDRQYQFFFCRSGPYAMAQVNYITKSGTNAFHGDLSEMWNGSRFNAENYFLHANDTPGNIAQKPHDVVNEFGVSVGGPFVRASSFSLPTMKASASHCRSSHQLRCPRPPISSMCWASLLRVETTR